MRKKQQRDIPATEEIKMFMHCGLCLEDFKNNAPGTEGVSPADYARLAVGWTPIGLQVWCERHGANVLHVDFEGEKHPANTSRIAKETVQ